MKHWEIRVKRRGDDSRRLFTTKLDSVLGGRINRGSK